MPFVPCPARDRTSYNPAYPADHRATLCRKESPRVDAPSTCGRVSRCPRIRVLGSPRRDFILTRPVLCAGGTERHGPTGFKPAHRIRCRPPNKSHTVRNILLAILAMVVLVIGGCVAFLGFAANEVNEAIETAEAEDAAPGGSDNPLTIVEGQGFDVSGFRYASGWQVSQDSFGDVRIEGLKVTNNRTERDGALVEVKFMRGNEVVALVDCSTEQIPRRSDDDAELHQCRQFSHRLRSNYHQRHLLTRRRRIPSCRTDNLPTMSSGSVRSACGKPGRPATRGP